MEKRLEPVEVEESVPIPTLDGKSAAAVIKVKDSALRALKDGEIYIGAEAVQAIDRAKARHMRLLLPTQIK
jgi:hypothetical protein